jgi:hypothetical protein
VNHSARWWLLVLAVLAFTAGCDLFTDAATRLAYDLEAGASRLNRQAGAKTSIRHGTPSKSGECTGPYRVQFDKVGALIVWCYGAGGETVSSHSTTYHARLVDTPQTWLLDKPAGAPLTITLERRGGRALITDVR